MATPLPTIVVVPGAWHSPPHYQDFMDVLEKAGYPTVSGTLPSLNPPDPDKVTVSLDAAFIRDKHLSPLLSAGNEVVLVMHSYGGSPGGVAANGLSISERKERGEKGGVLGLVFVAAFLTTEGGSLKAALGGNHPPWVKVDTPKQGLVTPSKPLDIFYHDVPSSRAAEAVKSLQPSADMAFSTPTEAPAAWASTKFDGRRAYIRCADDQAMPSFAQDGMLASTGVEWDVHQFDTSHSPFLSNPEKLAETIVGLAKKWSEV